jgi:restriction system protein
MHENSLFAVLLGSPWWASALAALGLAGGLRLVIPEIYALFAALPFAVIAVYVAWKQLRAPSAERIAGRLERVRAMPWAEFSGAMEQAFRREGYWRCIYVAAGEITAQAAAFAAEKNIRLLHGAELARMLPR